MMKIEQMTEIQASSVIEVANNGQANDVDLP